MNVQMMISSKNPLMCIGMLIMFMLRNMVRTSSMTNTKSEKNRIFQGIRYTFLSLTGVAKSLINNQTVIKTNPRLYRGATSAMLSARLIHHTPA